MKTLLEYEALSALIDTCEKHGGSGVLITLDEVHGKQGREDLIDLADQFQHLVRRDRNIALAVAGLPAAVEDLLNEDVTTYLRRAKRFQLGPLTRAETEDAIALPIRAHGREIAPDALAEAVTASAGYPYLIQIIGDNAWRRTTAGQEIGVAEVDWGVRRAIESMGQQVHGPALHDLSPVDREFLHAMAEDEGPSATRDIADRMGRGHPYISRYRARLIAAEIIRPLGYGRVEFALPYLREYLLSLT